MIRVSIDGLADIDDNMRKLLSHKKTFMMAAAGEAIIAALTPMVDAAQRNAVRDTGTLKNSIGFRVKPYKRRGNVFAVVGPRRGFKGPDGRDPAKYGHLVEFGHTTKNGKVAINPFMRPAWDETRGEMTATIARVIGGKVAVEAKRLASRKRRKK